MSYTPMSDLGRGLFDITRLLLQQPDLAAPSENLTRLVQQSALADERASCGTRVITARPGTPAMRPAIR